MDPAGAAILIGNNGVNGTGTAGRYNHGGSGTHVLAADGHVKWIATRGPEDLTTRFNRATATSADRAFANADDGLR
jgi:prepilin-type processing-associated H-X9-DG protein